MTIKVRCDDFSLVTRRHTSAMPGRDADDIASRAVALLERTQAGPELTQPRSPRNDLMPA
jgi:hypothetical protein